jgi:hypothetical protein
LKGVYKNTHQSQRYGKTEKKSSGYKYHEKVDDGTWIRLCILTLFLDISSISFNNPSESFESIAFVIPGSYISRSEFNSLVVSF